MDDSCRRLNDGTWYCNTKLYWNETWRLPPTIRSRRWAAANYVDRPKSQSQQKRSLLQRREPTQEPQKLSLYDSKCHVGRNLIDFTSQIPKKRQSEKFGDFAPKVLKLEFYIRRWLFKSGEELRWQVLGKRKTTLGCADATKQYFLQTAINQYNNYCMITCLYILDLESLTVRFNPCPPNYHSRNLAEAKHTLYSWNSALFIR